MAFHPHMQIKIQGLEVVENLRLKVFDGAIADLWDVKCEPYAHGEYVSHAPRLVVVMGQTGDGQMEIVADPGTRARADDRGNRLAFIPAGYKVWSRIDNLQNLSHLDVHFDTRSISKKLGDDFEPSAVDVPKLSFNDERIMALSRLVADECDAGTALHDLYGDSLICALFIALAGIKPKKIRHKGQLSAHHLRKAIEFLEDNFDAPVSLAELSSLTGLSPAYFCHSFKLTTGMPPHRWRMRVQVNRAKQQLEDPNLSLSSIAAATGFSDQAHFTRVFRKFTGTTPGAWRMNRDK
ncbi:helix-turn-helix domain-containing protein [Roseibium sp.]|uniref:helix-turn-helix domain-containing protein n=1 Tax=Roseibium sp. TaxID=1936156 RepID=UPI003B50B03F